MVSVNSTVQPNTMKGLFKPCENKDNFLVLMAREFEN